MRIVALSLLALSALALSACDELGLRQAKADCCCADKICPTPAPTKAAATGEPRTTAHADAKADGTASRTTVYRAGYRSAASTDGKVVRRWSRHGGNRTYSSSTEGVGYLDEDLAGSDTGGYRRASGNYGGSVSTEETDRYSETRRSSEGAYAYSSGGSGYSTGYRSGGGYASEGGSASRYSSATDGYAQGYSDGGDGRYGPSDRPHRRHRAPYTGTDRDGYLTWPGKQ